MNSPDLDTPAPEKALRNHIPLWQRGAMVALPLALVAAGVSLASRDAPPAAAPPPPSDTVAQPLARTIKE